VEVVDKPVPFEAHAPSTPNLEYYYDALGQVYQVKDAEALQVGDRDPYLFRIADGTRGERDDPLGGACSVTFDTYCHPGLYTDELGRVTTALIDSRARVVAYTYPEGDCEGFAYDDHNNTTAYTRVDKTGHCNVNQAGSHRIQTRASWDQTWNKPLTITTPNSNVTHFTYNASGNGASLLATATRPADGDGNVGVYKFEYDAAGKVTKSYVPFVGNATTTTQWIVISNTHDPTNEDLLTSTLDPGAGSHVNAMASFGYDLYGNVTSTTDARGNVTESLYDLDRRKTEDHHHDGAIAANLNAARKTNYDIIGRDIEEDAGTTFSGTSVSTWQMVKQNTYTPTSKVATVTDGDHSVVTNAYDGDDRVLTVTDPVGRKTHTVYDAAGQTLTELRAWAGSNDNCSDAGTLQECYATYTYGNDGEKLSEMDANGALATPQYATSYAYDGFNRLATTTFPDGSTEQITSYDKDSNILTYINRAGETTNFEYDALDQRIDKDVLASGALPQIHTMWHHYLDGAISDLNDNAGNDIYTLNNGSNVYYDTAGRLVRVDTTIPSSVFTSPLTTSYTLDANGNGIRLTWPDGY
jgi:YD repeat-containing protein